jgi:hypothetical protein
MDLIFDREQTTAVLSGSQSEYIKWLCKNKLKRSDYEFIDARQISIWTDEFKSPRDKFIVLKDVLSLKEWQRFLVYFEKHGTELIMEG